MDLTKLTSNLIGTTSNGWPSLLSVLTTVDLWFECSLMKENLTFKLSVIVDGFLLLLLAAAAACLLFVPEIG